MKLRFLLIIFIWILSNTSYGKELPWAAVAETKTIVSVLGQKKILRLQLDTLRNSETIDGSPLNFTISTWLSEEQEKIGYGYVDTEGERLGIWRYYIRKGTNYELFAEGSYTRLLRVYMDVDSDILKIFSSAGSRTAKEAYINSLKHPFLFDGEWRFYKNNKLHKLLLLQPKAVLPYQILLNSDETNSLVLPDPKHNRHSGIPVTSLRFNPSGVIEEIITNTTSMTFNPDGKPNLDPLLDLD